MEKEEFYKHYIPALKKALEQDDLFEPFNLKGPEQYLKLPENKLREMDIYLDIKSTDDNFLNEVAHYFDAKSHGFSEIDGVDLKAIKDNIYHKILDYSLKQNLK